MSAAPAFPLITLQPATDARQTWAALLLEGLPALDSAAVARVLQGYRLAEVLDLLPCVVAADPAAIDPALGAELPAGRVILRFPVAFADDPVRREALARLSAAGFGLMVTGAPAAGTELPPGITSLAVACPGQALPGGVGAWLRALPGPHLALGALENACPGHCQFQWLSGHLAQLAGWTPQGDPTTRGLLLKLLVRVSSDADTDEIESLIKRDTNLSYHLLKLVNSVAFAPVQRVTSFGHAIALLGRRQLQRWLQLLLYARHAGGETASPLLPRAALRASLMEALAKRLGLPRDIQEHAYMAGMFSLLDLLLGAPLAEILEPLNLPEAVVRALTRGDGPLGILLAAVVAGEGPPDEVLGTALAAAGLARETWAAALAEAMRWTVRVSREA